MAAPTPTARSTPGGTRLPKGSPSYVTLALDPDIEFYEIAVTPPGYEADPLIEITDQHNEELRTYVPGDLARYTDATITANYDPLVHTRIPTVMNRNQAVTFWWPNGDSVVHYAVPRLLNFGPLQMNTKPELTLTISPTNTDPTDCTEEAPVYTAGSGTANPCTGA